MTTTKEIEETVAGENAARIPLDLLLEADRDPGLRGRVHPRREGIRRVPIERGGVVVGFYTPHVAADGSRRLGPIYVRPEHRGLGLVSAVYRSIEGPMLAAVLDVHAESMRLHERVGFVRWRRFGRPGRQGWMLRRA